MRNLDAFQGNLKKKKYFEGYYYKISQDDFVISFIVGVVLGNDSHSFIQILENNKSIYLRYPLEAFQYKKNKFKVKIENNIFTDKYINLDIDDEKIKIKTFLSFFDIIKPKKSIMGPFRYFPFMECKHHIVHLTSKSSGIVNLNDTTIILKNAKSYIEKDYGKSFPKQYTWIQGNDIDQPFMLSIARIPYLGIKFQGIISIIKYNNRFINISTYNGAEIVRSNKEQVIILNRKYTLILTVLSHDDAPLMAPIDANMEKEIFESNNAKINILLKDKNDKTLFQETCSNCGFEYVE